MTIKETKIFKVGATYSLNKDKESEDYNKLTLITNNWYEPLDSQTPVEIYDSNNELITEKYKLEALVKIWNNEVERNLEDNTFCYNPLVKLVENRLYIIYEAYFIDSSFNTSFEINYHPITGKKL